MNLALFKGNVYSIYYMLMHIFFPLHVLTAHLNVISSIGSIIRVLVISCVHVLLMNHFYWIIQVGCVSVIVWKRAAKYRSRHWQKRSHLAKLRSSSTPASKMLACQMIRVLPWLRNSLHSISFMRSTIRSVLATISRSCSHRCK